MNIDSPYNALLGQNWLGEMRAVASSFHQKMKFLSPKGVVVVRGKQEDTRYCFNLAIRGSLSKRKNNPVNNQVISAVDNQSEPKSITEKGEPSSSKREGNQT